MPAEIDPTAEGPTLAVMVDPFSPKLTPLLFEKTTLEMFPEVVPPLKLMLPWLDAAVADAVIVLPFSPKLTLLELLNTIAVRLFEVVPPDKLTAEINPAVEGTV